MKKTVIALTAPILGFTPVLAEDVSAPAQPTASAAYENSNISPYIGLSGVFGEQSETVITPALGEDGSYDVEGVRITGGVDFGNGLSIDSRYERLHGDLYEVDIDSDEFRALLNYEYAIEEGLSVFGGIGYGWLSHEGSLESLSLDVSGDGLLLNAGAKFASGQLFGSLVYTHCFTQSAEADFRGFDDLADELGIVLDEPVDGTYEGEEEDIGSIEATVGYNITKHLAATLSWEVQVNGDTLIEKDWVAAIGLQYKF